MSEQPASTEPGQAPDLHQPEVHESLERYWKSNIRITLALLAIWAVVGLGCGVLFADKLNAFHFLGTGYPLGFWFAQQGSIIVFVLIILFYCIAMNRLDKKHHEELEDIRRKGRATR